MQQPSRCFLRLLHLCAIQSTEAVAVRIVARFLDRHAEQRQRRQLTRLEKSLRECLGRRKNAAGLHADKQNRIQQHARHLVGASTTVAQRSRRSGYYPTRRFFEHGQSRLPT